ncbi:hypothetical protein [Devosia sp. 63-57]|uniref:hypothetical protein n=1 Tax=Devosia sp. 63-57 TaxID=1895751 RepID=UPI0008687A0D|nr:hypothetical protein [Devosia sp. 63-57]ODT48235.1 MAG: hypothetical protein ABS74_18910 [Pelagibacterium sp. SCN 63-126]ODU84277.1 MAG: hypothetical protein ABT14_14630 [Pelagibacterium sp. SCN 63-17]OJX42053.1 MAG: hypothetical protein BGO80_10935 [Devosia sp. 63-57]
MIRLLLVALSLCLSSAVLAQSATERAFDAAIAQTEAALPQLGAEAFGVDVKAYRDALSLRRFTSRHWGGEITVAVVSESKESGSCARYAAYVRLPPERGAVRLVLCPQFSTPGADDLRRLTILHEMVHVVAGSNECQAMAFAALIEQLATGSFTPVTRYWEANGCAGSGYALP